MLETNISLAPNRVNLPPSEWTDIRVIRLTQLWQDGLTASQVAAELGGFEHCRDGGRSAVIGKVHRLHLPERSAPQRYPRIPRPKRDKSAANSDRAATQRIAKMIKVRHPENGGVEEVNIVIRDEGPRPADFLCVGLLDLEKRHCRFPHGGDDGIPITFCGQEKMKGESYCLAHHRIAYNAPKPISPRPYLPTGGTRPAVF
jgi:GcrA cell cycle regulator